MAQFNPDVGISDTQIPTQTYASRGIPTNRAMETLFSGIGDIAKGAAQTVDTKLQYDIRSDVENFRDVVNDQFGVGVAAGALGGQQVAAGKANAGVSNVPPQLQSDANNLSLIQQARVQGKLTEAHYWDLVTMKAKELRSRYPGYNQQIDDIIDNVMIGRNPANRLREQLNQQYSDTASAITTADKQLDSQIYSNKEYLDDPTVLQRLDSMSRADKQQVLSGIATKAANDQKYKSDNLQLENQAKNDQAAHTMATNMLNERASQVVASSMNTAFTIGGFTGKDIAGQIQKAAATGKASPQDIQQMQANIAQWENNIQQQLNKMRMDPAGQRVSGAEFDDITKKAMAPVQFYKDMLNNQQTGIVVQQANSTKLLTDRRLNDLLQNNQALQSVIAIGKISPDLVKELLYNNYGGSTDLLKAVMPGLLGTVAGGTQSADDAAQKAVNQKGLSANEQQQIVNGTVTGFSKLFSSPNATDDNIRDLVKKNFGDAKFNYTWQHVNDEDKYKLFATLSAPQVTDRIAKLPDGDLKQSYMNWLQSKWTDIPDVRLMAANIDNANQQNPESVVQFRYNPQTYTFQIVPQGATQFGMAPEQRADAINSLQQRMVKFNSGLINVAHAMKAFGQDPNQEIPKLLNTLAIQNQNPNKQSYIPDMQKAIISSNNPEFRAPSFEGDTVPGSAGNDSLLHLANVNQSGQSANPFIVGTANNLLSYVSEGESGGNYNAYFGHTNSNVDFSHMTVDQVQDFQKNVIGGNGDVGKYEITIPTMDYLKSKLGLTGNEMFTPELQDRMGMQLLVRRGYKEWASGAISDQEFKSRLDQEFVSVRSKDFVQAKPQAGEDTRAYEGGNIYYANQSAIRNQPMSPKLTNTIGPILDDLGVRMVVISGGQDSEGEHRTGSHRHDNGMAADADFYIGNHKLTPNNPQDRAILSQIVSRGSAAGITGWGEGENYMGSGRIHLGYGPKAVWGAGGLSENAPIWLKEATQGITRDITGNVSQNDIGGGAGNDILQQTSDQVRGAIDAFHHEGNLENMLQSYLRGNQPTPQPDLPQPSPDNLGKYQDNATKTGFERNHAVYMASPKELKEGYLPQGLPQKMPMGMTQNNPGNLKFTGSAFQKQYFQGMEGRASTTDQGAHQIKFATPEDGLAAMATLSLIKNQNGKDTLKKMMFDNGGYTPGFKPALDHIQQRMSIDKNDKINLTDRPTMYKFMRSLLLQEVGFAGNTYTDKQINQAIDRAYQLRGDYNPLNDKTHPDYKKLRNQQGILEGSESKNVLRGGEASDRLPADQREGKEFAQRLFRQTIAPKGEQLQGNEGTFDSRKLPEGSYSDPTNVEDRTQGFDRPIDAQASMAYSKAMQDPLGHFAEQYKNGIINKAEFERQIIDHAMKTYVDPQSEWSQKIDKFNEDLKADPSIASDILSGNPTSQEKDANDENILHQGKPLIKSDKGNLGIPLREPKPPYDPNEVIGDNKYKNQSRLGQSDLPSPEAPPKKEVKEIDNTNLMSLQEFFNNKGPEPQVPKKKTQDRVQKKSNPKPKKQPNGYQ